MVKSISYSGAIYENKDKNATPEQLHQRMARMYPELEKARYEISADGNMNFLVDAGTKG